ncbi:Cationic amino acid transporter 1 [Linum perenne]
MINIFLIGLIDKASFWRFGVWTALLLVYYLFGMHATDDVAKELEEKRREINTKSSKTTLDIEVWPRILQQGIMIMEVQSSLLQLLGRILQQRNLSSFLA